tara:strand:- start:186 stop:533 length:348 start_codon:yes stop_codon:yes gene_type:complete
MTGNYVLKALPLIYHRGTLDFTSARWALVDFGHTYRIIETRAITTYHLPSDPMSRIAATSDCQASLINYARAEDLPLSGPKPYDTDPVRHADPIRGTPQAPRGAFAEALTAALAT